MPDYLIETKLPDADFRGDILKGLVQEKKQISPKYLYDIRGSKLFEQICTTPEYYLTRCESTLLRTYAKPIADAIGPEACLIEPGSGAAQKAQILLGAMQRPAEYCLFDISAVQMQQASEQIKGRFPDLRVGAVSGDFTAAFPQPSTQMFKTSGKRILFFPGSTIGNFDPPDQLALLQNFKSWLRSGDVVLLGVDMIKDSAILDAAYNDAAGYTSEFNLNILHRMQSELSARLCVEAFRHLAFFNVNKHCVEIYLQARYSTKIHIGNSVFPLSRGELIHTENSWKFNRDVLAAHAKANGFILKHLWQDRRKWFSMAWMEVR